MRRATVRTRHDDPETVAAAVRPDNTAEMTTAVRDGVVATTVERETTAGLRSTVDDYVVNLRVADRTVDDDDRNRDGSDLGEQRDDGHNDHNHE